MIHRDLNAAKPALIFAVLLAASSALADSALADTATEVPAAQIATNTPASFENAALSINTCVEMALAASAQAAQAASKTQAAASRLDFARAQYVPSLTFSGSFTYSSEIEPGAISVGPTTISLPETRRDSWLFRLTLQQPLFTGFRIESGIAQAEAALKAAQAEERRARAAVASAAEKAWWALYLADRSAAVVEENAAAQRAHVAEAQARLEGGAGLSVELLSARKRAADLETLAGEARSSLALARARLNLLLGLPWDAPTAVIEPPEPQIEKPSAEPSALVAAAKAARPELAAAAARLSMQKAAAAVARSPLLPNVFVTGSYSFADPNPKVFPQRDGFESLWDIGLLVSFDLGRIPATLAQAAETRAGIHEASLGLTQLENSVEFEVISAYLELLKCADRLYATESSVALAEEALRSQRELRAAGLAVDSAVVDAENELLRAKLERTRSRVSWELARIALRDALGE
jgi:outer membrane protein TolC